MTDDILCYISPCYESFLLYGHLDCFRFENISPFFCFVLLRTVHYYSYSKGIKLFSFCKLVFTSLPGPAEIGACNRRNSVPVFFLELFQDLFVFVFAFWQRSAQVGAGAIRRRSCWIYFFRFTLQIERLIVYLQVTV